MTKQVLVTGAAGYVGSVFVENLLKLGYQVVCIDNLKFGQKVNPLFYTFSNFIFHEIDLLDCSAVDNIFSNYVFDAVVHLAAIVGDPACKQNPDLAESLNWTATKYLIDQTKKSGISRFIFSSTCSNYGKMDNVSYVSEDSPLRPCSLYAKQKVRVEQYLLDSGQSPAGFHPTCLRFATVFGVSHRMRFDLTVNEFVRTVYLKQNLEIYGEQFWRPYCHVKDIALALLIVMNAEVQEIDHEVYNVGSTVENYTKKMIVDCITEILGGGDFSYVHKAEDPRDYRVNFDKIHDRLGFKPIMTLSSGIKELVSYLSEHEASLLTLGKVHANV